MWNLKIKSVFKSDFDGWCLIKKQEWEDKVGRKKEEEDKRRKRKGREKGRVIRGREKSETFERFPLELIEIHHNIVLTYACNPNLV